MAIQISGVMFIDSRREKELSVLAKEKLVSMNGDNKLFLVCEEKNSKEITSEHGNMQHFLKFHQTTWFPVDLWLEPHAANAHGIDDLMVCESYCDNVEFVGGKPMSVWCHM